ncbi:MAG: type 4a pilus biogenesis protein PilO [Gammaproteobacteria bacterium]|nr:type 4a pilus biogenesis protein PilO [Gammaproteobacteria bacterium]MDH5654163.1 type 4a pilus biogenesis protein PilO [Gammaproteobacteria bacterium]
MSEYTWYLPIRYALRHPVVRLSAYAWGGGLLVAVCATLYWMPKYTAWLELDKQVSAQRQQIYTNERQQRIADLLARSRKSFQTLEKKLSSGRSQSDHVKELDKLLRNRRLTVMNETFTTTSLEGGYVRLTQELSVQGDYLDLRKFLLDLDRLPSWTVVQDIRIEKLHSYGSRIKAVLKMATYRRDEKQKNEHI